MGNYRFFKNGKYEGGGTFPGEHSKHRTKLPERQ